jgi:hypothetical protein
MRADCDCGMTLEGPVQARRCGECGAACCQACAMEIETEAYCRWCAVSRTVAA